MSRMAPQVIRAQDCFDPTVPPSCHAVPLIPHGSRWLCQLQALCPKSSHQAERESTILAISQKFPIALPLRVHWPELSHTSHISMQDRLGDLIFISSVHVPSQSSEVSFLIKSRSSASGQQSIKSLVSNLQDKMRRWL